MHVAHLVLKHAMSVASFVLALLLIARAGVRLSRRQLMA